MEYKDIKKLMDDVGNSKLSEVEIEFPDGTKVSLKKNEIKEKIITEMSRLKAVFFPVVKEFPRKNCFRKQVFCVKRENILFLPSDGLKYIFCIIH